MSKQVASRKSQVASRSTHTRRGTCPPDEPRVAKEGELVQRGKGFVFLLGLGDPDGRRMCSVHTYYIWAFGNGSYIVHSPWEPTQVKLLGGDQPQIRTPREGAVALWFLRSPLAPGLPVAPLAGRGETAPPSDPACVLPCPTTPLLSTSVHHSTPVKLYLVLSDESRLPVLVREMTKGRLHHQR